MFLLSRGESVYGEWRLYGRSNRRDTREQCHPAGGSALKAAGIGLAHFYLDVPPPPVTFPGSFSLRRYNLFLAVSVLFCRACCRTCFAGRKAYNMERLYDQ